MVRDTSRNAVGSVVACRSGRAWPRPLPDSGRERDVRPSSVPCAEADRQETSPEDSGRGGEQEDERGERTDLRAEFAELSRRVDEHLKRLEGA